MRFEELLAAARVKSIGKMRDLQMYRMLQLFCAAVGFSFGVCCALMKRKHASEHTFKDASAAEHEGGEERKGVHFKKSKGQSRKTTESAAEKGSQKHAEQAASGDNKGLPEDKALELAQSLGAKVSAPETDPLLEVPPQQIAELRTAV